MDEKKGESLMQMDNKACFLDRDWVLIEEQNYLASSFDVKLLPNAIEALKLLRVNGYATFC